MTGEFSETELASRGKRLGGAVLDGVIASALTIPLMIYTGVFENVKQSHPMPIQQRVLFIAFGLVLFLILNGYLLSKQGQTIGKKLVGTRIVSVKNNHTLPLGQIFTLRYLPLTLIGQIPLIGNIFSIVDCFMIFRKDKRCIHDFIAGTKVINA